MLEKRIFMPEKYTINVPATSANFGCCFDFAGIAIPDLFNTVQAEQVSGNNVITIEGFGADVIPRNENNLIYKTFKRTFEYAGKKCPTVKMHCINRIPLNRGLGSSAAASLGGIFLANAMLSDKLTKEDMLSIACEFEGHPDNAAPAIYGGMAITAYIDGKPVIRNIELPKDIYVAVAVPEILLSTSVSRAVLPENYSRRDIVCAMSTATLAIDAIREGDYALMGRLIMRDVVHQPYRKSLIKGYDGVVSAALAKGAYGCVISGAGSTMISYCQDSQIAESVRTAMVSAFNDAGIDATGFLSVIKSNVNK